MWTNKFGFNYAITGGVMDLKEKYKCKFDFCVNCRNGQEGLVSAEVRLILCKFCKGKKSNYSPFTVDDMIKMDDYQRMIDIAKQRGSTIRFDPAWANL